MEYGKISGRQTFYILIVLIIFTAIMFLPTVTAQIAGRDAWLVPLMATVPSLYIVLVIFALWKKSPCQTIFQYLETILGVWPGKLVGIFYLFFFLHTNDIIIREFSELLSISVFPRTPPVIFHALMLMLCAWGVRGGLEVLARTIELLIPKVIFAFGVIFILVIIKEMDFRNFQPVLANGVAPILKATLAPEAWLGEVILLGMLLPYLVKPEEGKRSTIWAMVFVGLFLSATAFINTAVFGSFTAHLTLPTFELFRNISLGFFQRIEALIVAMWIVGLFAKIALFYYVFVLGTAQLAKLRDYRPLVLPSGALLTFLSMQTTENSVQLVAYATHVWPYFAMIFEYLIPTIILVVSTIKTRKYG